MCNCRDNCGLIIYLRLKRKIYIHIVIALVLLKYTQIYNEDGKLNYVTDIRIKIEN